MDKKLNYLNIQTIWLLCNIVFVSQFVYAGSASEYGISSNKEGTVSSPAITIDNNGNPVVAWIYSYVGPEKIVVKRWDGNIWVDMGFDITGDIYYGSPSIVKDKTGNIIIAWSQKFLDDYEIYIKKWDGNRWLEIGSNSASNGGISNDVNDSICPLIAIDKYNNPIVVWEDYTKDGIKIYIKKWDGNNWVEIGASSASGSGISNYPYPSSLSIVVDNNNNPVVAWDEHTIVIKKWDGNNWTEISNNLGSIFGYNLSSPRIFMGKNNNIIAIWEDCNYLYYNIYAKYWDGNNWLEFGIGSASGNGLSSNSTTNVSFVDAALDSKDYPVIVWETFDIDTENHRVKNSKIYIKRWDGNNWLEVGRNSATGNGMNNDFFSADEHVIIVDNDDNPIIAWVQTFFLDSKSGMYNNSVIYVKRWNGKDWVGTENSPYLRNSNFRCYNYPNPFSPNDGKTISDHSIITDGTIIKYMIPDDKDNNTVNIKIYNITGELIKEFDEGYKYSGYTYYVSWDGKDKNGYFVGSGVYVCVCKYGNDIATCKIAVIK